MSRNHASSFSILILAAFITSCAPDQVTTATEGADIIVSSEPATAADRQLYDALGAVDPPAADPVAIAVGMKDVDAASLPEARTTPAQTYEIGDLRTFWTHNNSTFKFVSVEAELMYISKYAYFWQHVSSEALNGEGKEATEEDWAEAGQSFDESYERVREVFGHEEWPGLDGDPRLYVIHSDTLGRVGGYFGQGDLLPKAIEYHSNEGQYFYISNTWASGIASQYYTEVLAHEFQHMVQKRVDPNEEGWLNEGMSMMAQQLAGMRGDNFVTDYLVKSDQSLWYWGSGSEDYGQAYLFLDYLFEQLGEGFIKSAAADPANGLTSIDRILAASGSARNTDEMYADALTAAFFDDPSQGDGRYGFRTPNLIVLGPDGQPLNAEQPPIRPRIEFASAGAVYTGTVEQYGGADIMSFTARGRKTLSFSGDQRLKLLPADAHSGENFWWSSRQDSSFSTLTRQVDLSDASEATLLYSAWYDIEEDWDYAYLLVSTDNGEHWTTLASPSSRTSNPNGQNLGKGFTGKSGRGESAVWIDEEVDLRRYAGQKILLRFAMQNDLAVNEFGFAVDDLSIPEIGWSDDVESGAAGWETGGFVLTHNHVPQVWHVRAVAQRKDGSLEVQDMEIADGNGSLPLDFGGVQRVLVFVIGQTRYTTTPAAYRLELGPGS